MNQNLKIAVPVILVVLIGVFLSQRSTLFSGSGTLDKAASLDSSAIANPSLATVRPAPSASESVASNLTASAPAPARFQVDKKVQEDLQNYSRLRKKVFTNDLEKEQMNNLLRDERFLSDLLPLLQTPAAKDFESEKTQSEALDLLFEAQKNGSSAANQVLSSIVSDKQIENESLPLADRQSLAGIKAEVLYQWSSNDSDAASRISQLLPGPKSQQIWQNVLERQQNNSKESEIESSKRNSQ